MLYFFISDIAKKIVILGDDIIDVVQGMPVTFCVQLQTEDGEIAESKRISFYYIIIVSIISTSRSSGIIIIAVLVSSALYENLYSFSYSIHFTLLNVLFVL